MVCVYKGKSDALGCGSYRGIKLLDHVMKVFERLLEERLRRKCQLMTCSLVSGLEEELLMKYS